MPNRQIDESEDLPARLGVKGARLRNPEAALRAFTGALSGGSIEEAVTCLAPGAVFITPDWTSVSGRDAIASVLEQLVAQGLRISAEPFGVLLAGDLACANQRWRLSRNVGGGRVYNQFLFPLLVLRRREDQWRLAITAPWFSLDPAEGHSVS
jgi:ketosteroid isomerase-like protein